MRAAVFLALALAVKPGHPDPKKFVVAIFPRILMPPPVQHSVAVTARIVGEITEAEYCAEVEFQVGRGRDAVHSKRSQDCPPFVEWRRQVAEHDECSQRVVVVPPGFEGFYNCPAPFDLQTEWRWETCGETPRQGCNNVGFGPGQSDVTVTFLLANGHKVTRAATISVAGGE